MTNGFIAQRLLGSSGQWYDIPHYDKRNESGDDAGLFFSRAAAEQNARHMLSTGLLGVVPTIRIVQVVDVFPGNDTRG